MFESLFVYSAVVKRHLKGPLRAERVACLEGLVGLGVAHATLLRRADYCLAVAEALGRIPRAETPAQWCAVEVDALATAWAQWQVTKGRAAGQRWPHDHFHLVAVEFLGTLGWLRAPPPTPPNPPGSPVRFDVAGAGNGAMANLFGHEAGNGGHRQAKPATPPLRSPTRPGSSSTIRSRDCIARHHNHADCRALHGRAT